MGKYGTNHHNFSTMGKILDLIFHRGQSKTSYRAKLLGREIGSGTSNIPLDFERAGPRGLDRDCDLISEIF